MKTHYHDVTGGRSCRTIRKVFEAIGVMVFILSALMLGGLVDAEEAALQYSNQIMKEDK